MLTTLSILSRDQGKLNQRPTTDADYFARFAPKPDPVQESRFTLRLPRLFVRKPTGHLQG